MNKEDIEIDLIKENDTLKDRIVDLERRLNAWREFHKSRSDILGVSDLNYWRCFNYLQYLREI